MTIEFICAIQKNLMYVCMYVTEFYPSSLYSVYISHVIRCGCRLLNKVYTYIHRYYSLHMFACVYASAECQRPSLWNSPTLTTTTTITASMKTIEFTFVMREAATSCMMLQSMT